MRQHSILQLVVSVLLLPAAMVSPTFVLGQPLIQFFAPDARSHGMAGAFTAIAEGPDATWWNPGALPFQESIHFSPFSYMMLVPDLADDVKLHNFGGVWSHEGFGVGAHISHINYGIVTVRDRQGVPIGTAEPTENVVRIGGGVDLLRLVADGVEHDRFQLGAGVNYKYFDSNLAGGLSSGAASWDMDLGTLFAYRVPLDMATKGSHHLTSSVSFRGGLVVNNLLNREIEYGDFSDPLDRQVRLGGAFEFEFQGLPPCDHVLKATVSVDQVHGTDVSGIPDATGEAIEHFGTELSVLGVFAIRFGYLHEGDAYSRPFSFNDWTWGFGAGADLDLPEWPRFGGRFDFARVVTAEELTKPKVYSASGWLTF